MTPSSTPLRFSAWLMLGVFLHASVARAGESGTASVEEQRARAESTAANQAYDLGQFDLAFQHYEEAYRLHPLPGFLFNLAQCQRQLGHSERAAFLYRRYLERLPQAPNREVARALLEDMEKATREDVRRQKRREEKALQEAKQKTLLAEAALLEQQRLDRAAKEQAALKGGGPGVVNQWWFWAGVGVVAVGVGAAAGTYLALNAPNR